MTDAAELHALFVRLPATLVRQLDAFAQGSGYPSRKAALIAILTKALAEEPHATS